MSTASRHSTKLRAVLGVTPEGRFLPEFAAVKADNVVAHSSPTSSRPADLRQWPSECADRLVQGLDDMSESLRALARPLLIARTAGARVSAPGPCRRAKQQLRARCWRWRPCEDGVGTGLVRLRRRRRGQRSQDDVAALRAFAPAGLDARPYSPAAGETTVSGSWRRCGVRGRVAYPHSWRLI